MHRKCSISKLRRHSGNWREQAPFQRVGQRRRFRICEESYHPLLTSAATSRHLEIPSQFDCVRCGLCGARRNVRGNSDYPRRRNGGSMPEFRTRGSVLTVCSPGKCQRLDANLGHSSRKRPTACRTHPLTSSSFRQPRFLRDRRYDSCRPWRPQSCRGPFLYRSLCSSVPWTAH